jgi:hypothetical protein
MRSKLFYLLVILISFALGALGLTVFLVDRVFIDGSRYDVRLHVGSLRGWNIHSVPPTFAPTLSPVLSGDAVVRKYLRRREVSVVQPTSITSEEWSAGANTDPYVHAPSLDHNDSTTDVHGINITGSVHILPGGGGGGPLDGAVTNFGGSLRRRVSDIPSEVTIYQYVAVTLCFSLLFILSIDWYYIALMRAAYNRSFELIGESEEDITEFSPWVGVDIVTEERLEREYRMIMQNVHRGGPVDHLVDDIVALDPAPADRALVEEQYLAVVGLPGAMEGHIVPEGVVADRTRGGGRRVRVSKLVRLLRARAITHFGRPKYTAANVVCLRNFLNSQTDVLQSVEAVVLPKMYRRVMYWVFNPSHDEIVDSLAMSRSSFCCCITNALVARRALYDANRPPT